MSTQELAVSVVIPVHNGAAYIVEQLEAVASSLAGVPKTEIVVVDNRSTDGTGPIVTQWAREKGIDVRLAIAADRAGEPYARNVGWRSATGDLILYCDADDVVGESWARALIASLRESEYATGPLDTQRLNSPELANLRGQALFLSVPLLHSTVPFAHGCNMGFRRSALERLGGFNESFLIGCDIEIAIRAWRRGVSLSWSPEAWVHYRLRSSPADIFGQARSYGRSRNRIDSLVPEVAPSRSSTRIARNLGWLVKHALASRERSGRMAWLWVAGQLTGEIEGRWNVGNS